MQALSAEPTCWISFVCARFGVLTKVHENHYSAFSCRQYCKHALYVTSCQIFGDFFRSLHLTELFRKISPYSLNEDLRFEMDCIRQQLHKDTWEYPLQEHGKYEFADTLKLSTKKGFFRRDSSLDSHFSWHFNLKTTELGKKKVFEKYPKGWKTSAINAF